MKRNYSGRAGWVLAVCCGLVACSDPVPTPPTAKTKPAGVGLAEASLPFLTIEQAGTGSASLGGVLPGRVAFRPQALAAVGAPVTARVHSIEVRPGEPVKAGAVLLTLQSAEAAAARSALEQASAKAATAEDLLRRQNEMLKKGVGLEVERFAAEMQAREARAELERARRTLELIGGGSGDRFVLRAPTSGVVIAVGTKVGALVSPGGEALVEVGDPTRLWVTAEVPESELTGIEPGMQAEIRIPGADALYEAIVDGLGQVIDGEQRRLPIYLALKGPLGKLSPGMLAEVRLLSRGSTALTLPTTAVLIKDGSRRIVYIQGNEGRFEARSVRTGISRDGRVTILEGVKPGEKVVVRGALLLDSEAEQQL